MLARSDWLEADKGNLHGHDETKKVEGHVGHVDPVYVVVGGGEGGGGGGEFV